MKRFRLSKEEIKQIIKTGRSCVASDKITIDGLFVGYMYRELPDFDTDSGWRFFSGVEDQTYVDNPLNFEIYDLNTIVDYDSSIIPYLDLPINSPLERQIDSTFA